MRILFTTICLCISAITFSQENQHKITGVVKDYGRPMSNVNIAVKGATEGTQTDSNGRYSISAGPRDVLVYSYVGMNTIEIIVEDVTTVLNIDMLPKIEQLDEVIVEQKKKQGQEALQIDYATNKNILRTNFGFIDTENVGYAISIVDGTELNPGAVDILSAIQGKFPGANIDSWFNPDTGQTERVIFMRGRGSANNPRPVIYEVDGTIFTSAPLFLQIQQIDRVAALPGLAAAVRYGTIAAGGVIVINTKGNNVMMEPGTNKVYDQAKLRNNIYDEGSVRSQIKKEAPKYVRDLEQTDSYEAAALLFDNQKNLYGSSPYFYLNAATFFNDKWPEKGKGSEIRTEMATAFSNDSNALKALAYLLEEENDQEGALKTYIDIFKNRPSYSQSYRDLANVYIETGNTSKALGLYARYKTSRRLDTVTTALEGVEAIISTELGNLLAARERSTAKAPTNTVEYEGIRVLMEWNNSEAEFDLQFVNPENHFVIWNHTLENAQERIVEEKMKGYSSEQFLIDKSLPGRWRINIQYFGNKSFDPTYLKTSVYYDYGQQSQRKVVKVFQLTEVNVNISLFSILNPNMLNR